MNRYQELAFAKFGVDGGPVSAESYVSVPASWSENTWNSRGDKDIINDPVSALAGAHYAFRGQFISIVSGPAGVGKSELVKQLCRRGKADSRFRAVFPVRLSSCKFQASSMVGLPERKITPGELCEFLFSSLLTGERSLSTDLVTTPSLKAIGDEGMIWALDGLDEIIGTKEQHKWFWDSLWDLIRTRPFKSGIHLLVTCRTDYLRSFSLDDRDGFGSFVANDRRLPFHFLGLDFFAPPQVRDLLRKRGVKDPFLNRIADRLDVEPSQIAEIMQRPLLLVLLCELRSMEDQCDANALPSEPTDLLDKLTQTAEHKKQGENSWSRDKIGTESLNLFKRTMKRRFVAPEFKVAEIDNLLILRDGQTLTDSQRLAAVHFCPFLRRDSENAIQFTHLLFFEYFVARGMYLQVGGEDDTPDAWIDFDRYVLPPDMRRFLRGLLREERWRERTLRSYSMQAPNGLLCWPDPEWAKEQFERLERIRYELLNFITEPDSADKAKAHEVLKEFLALDRNRERSRLFPAYRMYGFEALAVFVWTYRWTEGRGLAPELEKVLNRFLQGSSNERAAHDGEKIYIDSLERLALKTMEIGRRLKISSVMKQSARPSSSDWIRREDTRAEVDALMKDIRSQSER